MWTRYDFNISASKRWKCRYILFSGTNCSLFFVPRSPTREQHPWKRMKRWTRRNTVITWQWRKASWRTPACCQQLLTHKICDIWDIHTRTQIVFYIKHKTAVFTTTYVFMFSLKYDLMLLIRKIWEHFCKFIPFEGWGFRVTDGFFSPPEI